MKQFLTILILVFLFCDSPKSQETLHDWQLGPDEETLEPGVTYVREKGAELRFLDYQLNPREIAKKQVLPFREVFQDILKKKDFAMLVDITMGIQDEIEKKVNHLFTYGSAGRSWEWGTSPLKTKRKMTRIQMV